VQSAVVLKNVGYSYASHSVLTDITFTAAINSTVAVLGANGAGKSTLLQILAGVKQHHHGELEVLGCKLPQASAKLRPKVGLVTHYPLLYQELTAAENLLFYAQLYGVRPTRVGHLLSAAGLENYSQQRVNTLSRGLAQRLDLCRAVIHQPQLLLLDEPDTSLDPAGSEAVKSLLGGSATRIVTTHSFSWAKAEANYVLGLHDGQVAFFKPTNEIKEEEELNRLYAPLSAKPPCKPAVSVFRF